MDFTMFIPLIKECFLVYLKQQYKKKIQEEFLKDVYLKVDRTRKPNPENVVDQKTITAIEEFEKVVKEKYFVDIDNAKDENTVLSIYSDFVKEKDAQIQDLGDVYKKVYGKFIP